MDQTESITHIDSSGKQKYNSDLVDRINALPDCILDIILSFLPTKDAVATSVLSKRWKFLWMSFNNLDFRYERSYRLIHDEAENMRFVGFVNRVLLLHEGGLLNKFCLVWYHRPIASHASSWVNTAITKKVNELSLCLYNDVAAHERFDMPTRVFCCDSLRSLVLEGDISIRDAIVVCLPKLESLVLASVGFESVNFLEKLTSKCPMLNYMFLHIRAEAGPLVTYVISSTSLRRLDIRFEDREYQLALYTSSLEYLRLYGFAEVIFVQNGRLSSLVEAEFRIDCGIDMSDDETNRAWYCNPVIEAVRSFDCAKALNLSKDVMRALSCGTISLSTDFVRLVKLEAGTCCCACRSLQDIIQHSNNLEALTIHKSPRYKDDENDHDHSIWTDVPICFSNSLRKVVIYGYEGLEDECAMLQCMLEHGSGLEVLQISFGKDTSGEEFELLEEIREFPRMSVACEIKELSTPYVERLAKDLYTFPWD